MLRTRPLPMATPLVVVGACPATADDAPVDQAAGRKLAVANGSVRIQPDRDCAKLNLAGMQPSLTYLEPASGREDVRCGRHQASISSASGMPRSTKGVVAVAMQYEGSNLDRVPLVGLHDGAGLRLLGAPEEIQRRTRHYTGAIAS